jgi:hypothetical protein
VFCDSGSKKHPKIYGYTTATAAARAFDLLTCRRLVEKSPAVADFITASQASERAPSAGPGPHTHTPGVGCLHLP